MWIYVRVYRLPLISCDFGYFERSHQANVLQVSANALAALTSFFLCISFAIAILPLGDINTEAWSSGMGVGRGVNNPIL